jgi:chromosome segregation ATPase
MGKWKEKARELEAQVAEALAASVEDLKRLTRLDNDNKALAAEVKRLAEEGAELVKEGRRLKNRSNQLDAAVEALQEGAQEMVDANDALKPYKAMVEWLQEHKADLYAPQKGALHWSTITGYGSGRVITKGATAEEALRNSMERSDG